jgi:hypothetical protein
MIKKLKPAILLFLNLLLLQDICGQIPSDETDSLSKRFLRYCKAVPREEIYAHTDRTEYIAGEDLWFNLSVIDRQSFKLSPNSRIAYVELLNSENRPVVQKRILIEKGTGPGQVILPDTLSTGIYTFRAYTSWMKNFLPDNCFTKKFKIYNTLNTRAFVESSHLNNVIVKEPGKDANRDIKNKSESQKVNKIKKDSLEIIITTNNNFRSENDNLFYIFIQTHGNINYVSSDKTTGDSTRIKVPKNKLDTGINQITIFNSMGNPVSEKYIYTPSEEDTVFKLYASDNYKLRDKIILDLEPFNEVLKEWGSSKLSVSVAPLTNDTNAFDIADYLVFGTEYGSLPGKIIKGRKISELPSETIDSILLNIRSNWINWEIIASGNLPYFKYKAEKEDHFLPGKLLSDVKQLSHSEIVLMCSPGKDAQFQYARTDKNGNFRFNIHIDEGLNDLIIMPDNINKNQKILVESSFSDQYPGTEIPVDSLIKQFPAYVSKLMVNYQVRAIYGISSLGDTLTGAVQPLEQQRFYGKPDFELVMADYIKLPTMEEVFFELLPHVSLKNKKPGYEIVINDRVDNSPYITYPCLMIDGVIIKDASMIVNIDPETVEKIDVIKEKYLIGKYWFPGIINVITKSADFSCVPLPDYMIRIPYRVIDPVRSFVSPGYSSTEMKNSRIPDYRNTLYWNPSVMTDKNGKARIEFWSSDNKADYLINIQGISEDGKMLSVKKVVTVK